MENPKIENPNSDTKFESMLENLQEKVHQPTSILKAFKPEKTPEKTKKSRKNSTAHAKTDKSKKLS